MHRYLWVAVLALWAIPAMAEEAGANRIEASLPSGWKLTVDYSAVSQYVKLTAKGLTEDKGVLQLQLEVAKQKDFQKIPLTYSPKWDPCGEIAAGAAEAVLKIPAVEVKGVVRLCPSSIEGGEGKGSFQKSGDGAIQIVADGGASFTVDYALIAQYVDFEPQWIKPTPNGFHALLKVVRKQECKSIEIVEGARGERIRDVVLQKDGWEALFPREVLLSGRTRLIPGTIEGGGNGGAEAPKRGLFKVHIDGGGLLTLDWDRVELYADLTFQSAKPSTQHVILQFASAVGERKKFDLPYLKAYLGDEMLSVVKFKPGDPVTVKIPNDRAYNGRTCVLRLDTRE